MSKLLVAAQKYINLGYSVLPLSHGPKEDKPGKFHKKPKMAWKPLIKKPLEPVQLLTDPAIKKKFADDRPGNGLGIITGAGSNLTVVDLDTKEAIDWMKAQLPEGFKTVLVRTGSGGLHAYFKYRPGLPTTSDVVKCGVDGVDLRNGDEDGEGCGYVAVPPGLFSNGSGYTFVDGFSLDDMKPAAMPDSLYTALMENLKESRPAPTGGQTVARAGKRTKPGEGADWIEGLLLGGLPDGSRNNDLTRLGGYYCRDGSQMAYDDIVSIMRLVNEKSRNPLNQGEFDLVCRQVKKMHRDTALSVLDGLNENFAAVTLESGEFAILEKYTARTPTGKETDYRMITDTSFTKRFRNRTIVINKSPLKLAAQWLEWSERKEYYGVTFEPGGSPLDTGTDGWFNFWEGLAIEPAPGDWSLFRWHIENIVAGRHSEWLFQWMSRLVQDPGGNRPGTVPVFRGVQGCGKSYVIDTLGKIFGKHYWKAAGAGQLTRKFNGTLKNKVLINGEEVMWGGNHKDAGPLKEMITGHQLDIEMKGRDSYTIPNKLNFMIASNENWVVPTGFGERRFCVFDVKPDKAKDFEYWKALRDQMDNGGLEGLLYDLLRMDWDFSTISMIPRTGGTRNQILEGLQDIEQFWYARLYDGTLIDRHDYWHNAVHKDAFYGQYKAFNKELRRADNIASKKKFFQRIKDILPSFCDRLINRKGQGAYRVYDVLDLDLCRKEFDEAINGAHNPADWPEIEPIPAGVDVRSDVNDKRHYRGSEYDLPPNKF